jgi:hypothetical protein
MSTVFNLMAPDFKVSHVYRQCKLSKMKFYISLPLGLADRHWKTEIYCRPSAHFLPQKPDNSSKNIIPLLDLCYLALLKGPV